MRGNPNDNFTPCDLRWVHYGDTAVFVIPSQDPEVLHEIQTVLNDLFHEDKAPAPQPIKDGESIYIIRSRYTTHYDNVHRVLANVVERYPALDGVFWVANSGSIVREHLQQGVNV